MITLRRMTQSELQLSHSIQFQDHHLTASQWVKRSMQKKEVESTMILRNHHWVQRKEGWTTNQEAKVRRKDSIVSLGPKSRTNVHLNTPVIRNLVQSNTTMRIWPTVPLISPLSQLVLPSLRNRMQQPGRTPPSQEELSMWHPNQSTVTLKRNRKREELGTVTIEMTSAIVSRSLQPHRQPSCTQPSHNSKTWTTVRSVHPRKISRVNSCKW